MNIETGKHPINTESAPKFDATLSSRNKPQTYISYHHLWTVLLAVSIQLNTLKFSRPHMSLWILSTLFVIGGKADVLLSYSGWMKSSCILPRMTHSPAIGVDLLTNTMWIVGNYENPKMQLVSFDGSICTDHGTPLPVPVESNAGIFFTQIENILWIYNRYSNHLDIFNLTTQQYTQNYSTVPVGYSDEWGRSCISSVTVNHTYLIINGGFAKRSTEILNITNNEWIENVPSMNIARGNHACAVAKKIFYSIGGAFGETSMEILDMSDISNISNQRWILLNETLPRATGRAIVWKTDIIILATVRAARTHEIYAIDIVLNKVRFAGGMIEPVEGGQAIIVNDTVYYCGGTSVDGQANCQYLQLPTTTSQTGIFDSCLTNGHFANAWYDGSSIDLVNNVWYDKTAYNQHTTVYGYGIGFVDGVDTKNVPFVNGQPYVYGTTQTKIKFGETLLIKGKHTVFNLCKYNGGQKQRIIQSLSTDSFFGFGYGRSGVGHEYRTIWGRPMLTNDLNKYDDMWVLSVQSNDLYRANGMDWTTITNPIEMDIGLLQINDGYQAGESSDF
eukprot:64045_1